MPPAPQPMLVLLGALVYLLTQGTSTSAEISLAPSPALQHSDILQCGCNNSDLQALAPPSGQEVLREILLTGFFSIDRDDDSMSTCRSSLLEFTSGHLLPAAFTALDEINNSTYILPGYHLTLDVHDSRCDPVHATKEFIDAIGSTPPNALHLGILGPSCIEVVDTLAGIVSRSHDKFPVVSYAPSSHPLSMRESGLASVLFHMSRSVLSMTQSAIGLMRWLGWNNNTAFVSEEGSPFFLSTVETVLTTVDHENSVLSDGSNNDNDTVQVSEFVQFKVGADGFAPNNSMEEFFRHVRRRNIRVILAMLTQKVAAQLICTGKMGVLPGDGFLYVFVGSFPDRWWESETGTCDLNDTHVQSVIVVSGNLLNPNSSAVLQSGRTVDDFKAQYTERQRTWCDLNRYSGEAFDLSAGSVYDAVWTLALAMDENRALINKTFQDNLQYDPDTLSNITESLRSLNFTGVTGQVEFMDGDRIGAESIQQVQNGCQVVVALFKDRKLSMMPSQSFVWNGNANTTPSGDVITHSQEVDLYLLVIGLFAAVTGILFAIMLWGFNCYYSHHKILRASSQKLNYVIIIGVIFGYFTILILSALESPLGTSMNDDTFKALCVIRIWTLPLSFTFTYGILFARAWRIYRVFNNPWVSSRPYKDYHLLLMVLGLAFIDALILLPWTIIDPYRRFPAFSDVNYDTFSVNVYSSCSSDYVTVWLLVLSVYKVAIIMGGIFVISLVRKEVIERKIYDDTRSMAVAVYTTALAFMVGLPLTLLFLLSNKVVLVYIVSAGWVNISSWATQLAIFMPKLYKIMIKKDDGNSYKKARKLYYGREFSVANYRKGSNTLNCSTFDYSSTFPRAFSSIEASVESINDKTIKGTEDGTDL